MTDHTPPSDQAAAARSRHAALVAATEAVIDALPPLPLDATPQSFPALKARYLLVDNTETGQPETRPASGADA